ncbi:MAG: hypothetical protein ACJ0G2_00745 [Gammaproteobacteria bacterium]
MSMLNKVTEPIAQARMGILSEWSLRLVLSYLFFSSGQPKLAGLIDSPNEPLGFVKNLYLFSDFPVISSYLATIAELILIPIFIIVGGLKFIGPTAKALSTLGGLLGTFVMAVVSIWISFWCTWRKFLRRQISISTICYVDLFFI